jgi:hypothetical protein
MKRIGMMNIFILLIASIALADTISIGSFATEGLTGWDEKSFKGNTVYTVISDGNQKVVKADSRGTASGLFKKVRLDAARYRYLRWSWKVTETVKGGDERIKAGDDYAARLYVVFPGRFFWQTKAINYIWANRLAVGDHIPNAFTANAMMLAVESGNGRAGQWIREQRDVVADYRKLFGEEPREIGAIAIMTDTDNTGSAATAWYGDISLSTVP